MVLFMKDYLLSNYRNQENLDSLLYDLTLITSVIIFILTIFLKMFADSTGIEGKHVSVFVYICMSVCVYVCGHTGVIDGVDVSVAVDELFHHALHSQSCSQDQWGRSIIHTSV